MLGACLQVCVSLALQDSFYAILPATTLLSIRVLDALMIHLDLRPNPYLEKALPRKSTAVIPDVDGNLTGPGNEKIAVLMLGAKSNHPFGFFAPEFFKTAKWLAEMNAEFDKPDRPNGCKSPPRNPRIRRIILSSPHSPWSDQLAT